MQTLCETFYELCEYEFFKRANRSGNLQKYYPVLLLGWVLLEISAFL